MSMMHSTQQSVPLKNLHCEGGKKILLVDRDVNSDEYNVSLLQQMGYVVDVAENSGQGLAQLRAGNSYDMIFLDLCFFNHTALNFIQQMRDEKKCVILIADNLSYAIALDIYELGFDVARRPLSMAHIAEFLEENSIDLH